MIKINDLNISSDSSLFKLVRITYSVLLLVFCILALSEMKVKMDGGILITNERWRDSCFKHIDNEENYHFSF